MSSDTDHHRRRRPRRPHRRDHRRRGRRRRPPARGPRRARRPRPQHRGPVQGEPRTARAAVQQPVLGLARRARPAAARARAAAGGFRFRWHDEIRRVPAVGAAVAALRLRGRKAPVELDFRTWAAEQVGLEAADQIARSAGILTYYHDPGELSAAFVWEPIVRAVLAAPPTTRYPIGGWSRDRRADAAIARAGSASRSRRALASSSSREPPVIVATELPDARALLGRRVARLAERQRRLPRPRARAPPRRSVRRRRPAGDRLGRALHRRRPDARAAAARS